VTATGVGDAPAASGTAGSSNAPGSGDASATTPRPLAGLLVVALEQAVAAPLCTCRLADAGARVVKLERPEGDFARGYDSAAGGGSSYFVWLNRGKESVVVDLRVGADLELVRRLVARADVFVENLAPGAVARLGLAPDELRERNPRLVTCSITGYGDGPYRTRKAYDLLIQAESGLASVTGTPDGPGRVGVSVVDVATGLNAYASILEALRLRDVTGRGSHVESSLFGAIAEWMTVPLLHYEHSGRPPARVGLAHPSIAPYGVYACRDGTALLLSIQNAREWRSLCAGVLGDAALADDPRYADNDSRVRNRPELDALVAERLGALDVEEAERRLDAAGIAYGRLNDVGGFARHPHLHRLAVATERGPVSVPVPPGWRARPGDSLRVPALGEHTERVRAEFQRDLSRHDSAG
jgi:crotonobetainyl-CoA:carnitine CoA-transferase CaiB-like acyl-CoA transferase